MQTGSGGASFGPLFDVEVAPYTMCSRGSHGSHSGVGLFCPHFLLLSTAARMSQTQQKDLVLPILLGRARLRFWKVDRLAAVC